MNGKMRSCVMGLILSLFSSPLPMAQKQPVAYLYNGVRLPKLPEWDKTVYPYAMITEINSTKSMLWVMSEKPYYFLDEDGRQWLQILAPYSQWANYTKQYIWDDWGSSESDINQGVAVQWTNFDLYNADGTVSMLASEPIATTEWDYVIAILYDGEATTADDGNGVYVSGKLTSDNAASFTTSNAYRITFDGVSTVEDVGGASGSYYLGNPYLYDPSSYEDNGGSWCIRSRFSIGGAYYLLHTRNSGTYNLKLESVRE